MYQHIINNNLLFGHQMKTKGQRTILKTLIVQVTNDAGNPARINFAQNSGKSVINFQNCAFYR